MRDLFALVLMADCAMIGYCLGRADASRASSDLKILTPLAMVLICATLVVSSWAS